MKTLSVTYASSPSSDLLIPTLEFNNETAEFHNNKAPYYGAHFST